MVNRQVQLYIQRKRDSRLDIVLLANDMSSNFQPKFLPQHIILLRLICTDLCELEIIVLESEVDTRFVEFHLGIDEDASLNSLVSATQSKCVIEIVVRVTSIGIGRSDVKEVDEIGFIV